MSTQHQVSWDTVKSKIKHKWKKIDEVDLDEMKGNLEMLSDKLQSIYSYPKSKADKEASEFKASLEQKPKHH